MDASVDGTVPPASAANKENTTSPSKGSKVSVSDFVSASFARFEAEYGPSAFVEVSAGPEASRLLRTNAKNNTKTTNNEEDEEEDDEPFWSLLLTLYLPLLVFGLRRSTFGTFSFVRTFLLGHVLRLLISVILFSIPTSFSERFQKWWLGFIQLHWVQHIFWAVTGEERFHPNHYSEGISTGGLGAPAGGSRNKHPDQVWPPPALTLLTLVTVMAFVIHPDGLTWIIIGKALEVFMYLINLATVAVVMLRDEPIHTIAAATSLAGIVLLGGVIHRTLSPKTNYSAQNAAGPSSSSRKKKGKKGRHGRQNNHNARGRGKVRGGHFRSSKDLYESPTRNRSRSRSPTPPRPEKKQFEEKGAETDNIVDEINGNTHPSNAPTEKSRTHTDSTESLTTHSHHSNSLSKLRPYSVDSSLPQLSDDVSSCSSITGSLIDVPGSKPLKGVLEEADRKSNRRKHKNHKRGKNSTAVGLQCHSSQASTFRCPPGFIADDPAMTPTRVSPLTLSNPSPSPYKGSDTVSSISPARKTISRPPPHNKGKHNANRSRASTSDGTVKHAHSAPLPSTSANAYNNSSRFQTQSQSLNQPPGIVRYGLPDYSIYAQNDSRYDPKKIELAAFLTRVGLVGSACADLLRDLQDVDSLAALSPQQLYMYNVRDEKQMEIAALLKARELRLLQLRMQNTCSATSSSVIRPPPGLGFGSAHSSSSSAVAPIRSKPVQPISRPLAQARSFTPDDNTSGLLLSSPTSSNSNHLPNNFNLQSLRSSVDNSGPLGNASNPIMQASFQHDSSRLSPIGSRLFSPTIQAECVQSEDDKIDADLQQLGDRMAGSILDF